MASLKNINQKIQQNEPEVFDVWNIIKKETEERDVLLGFKVREVWFIRMGKNIGFEQDGRGGEFLRPVLVFKRFNKQLFWGIPLTGKKREGAYYYSLPAMRGRNNTLILSQLRLFDAKRLRYKIGVCPVSAFCDVIMRIKNIIDDQEFETPASAGEARRHLQGNPNK